MRFPASQMRETEIFPGVAIDAYEKMIDIEDIGKGSATRLLALARPDYLVFI